MVSGGASRPCCWETARDLACRGCNHHPKAAFADVRPLLGAHRTQSHNTKHQPQKWLHQKVHGTDGVHPGTGFAKVCALPLKIPVAPTLRTPAEQSPHGPHLLAVSILLSRRVRPRAHLVPRSLFLLSRLRDSHLGLQVLTSSSLSIPEQPFSHSFLPLLPRSPLSFEEHFGPVCFCDKLRDTIRRLTHTTYHIKEKTTKRLFHPKDWIHKLVI